MSREQNKTKGHRGTRQKDSTPGENRDVVTGRKVTAQSGTETQEAKPHVAWSVGNVPSISMKKMGYKARTSKREGLPVKKAQK